MISLIKILFTAAVIAGVWLIFFKSQRPGSGGKVGRFARALGAAGREVAASAKARHAPEPAPPTPDAQDLVACPLCGSYVPAGPKCKCASAP